MHAVYLNNELVASKDAHISPHDRGWRYGDGVFDTLLVSGGVPYRFDWHMARMAHGLKAIKIECELKDLPAQCRELLQHNKIENGLLRIQVTRGIGGRGYLPEENAKPTVLIETLKLPQLPKEPVTLWQSAYEKISPRALPTQYKLCQGLNSTLARIEAREHNCFDALLLNNEGHIAETGSANIFWLRNKIIFTPPISAGALGGAMRAAIMELFPVKEISAGIDALREADAVFITNVAGKALAVKQLLPDGKTWDSAGETRIISEALNEDMRRRCEAERARWQGGANRLAKPAQVG